MYLSASMQIIIYAITLTGKDYASPALNLFQDPL